MSFEQFGDVVREGNAFRLAPPGRITDETLDVEVLKALERVKTDDGLDLLVELIDLYLEDTPQRIMAIRSAAAEKNWVQLKRAAHTVKGSSGTLGLRQVARVCQELEEASSPGSTEGVEALVQLLEYKFLKARQALAAERQRRLQ